MARHINHFDAQDKIIARNNKMANTSSSLADRDPATLTIPEQEALVKERIAAKIKNQPPPKVSQTRFTGKK